MLTVTTTSVAGTTDVPVTTTMTGVDCTVTANPWSHAELVADYRVPPAILAVLEGDSDVEIDGSGTLNRRALLVRAGALGEVSTGGTPNRVAGLDLDRQPAHPDDPVRGERPHQPGHPWPQREHLRQLRPDRSAHPGSGDRGG